MNTQEQITHIRVEYTKRESLRFTGHLDVQRLWERLLRRSRLPIRYSQGFHPRARLNLASALPLGFTSESELLDFWMDEPISLDEIKNRLKKSAPPGLEIKTVKYVDLSEDALQSTMHASQFEVLFFNPQIKNDLEEKVNALLIKDEIIRVRRKKTYDLRPLILSLSIIELPDDQVGLRMTLLAEPGQTGRPDEVLDALGFSCIDHLVCRTKNILKND